MGLPADEPNAPGRPPAGNEASVVHYVNATGLMHESAHEFGALLLFVEHRQGDVAPANHVVCVWGGGGTGVIGCCCRRCAQVLWQVPALWQGLLEARPLAAHL